MNICYACGAYMEPKLKPHCQHCQTRQRKPGCQVTSSLRRKGNRINLINPKGHNER